MPQKTYMYDTQWNQLINAINTGDSSAVVTALNTIKNSLDNITNAISNQTITVDLSNINSDNVSNLSSISATNVTNALNILANHTNIFNRMSSPVDANEGFNLIFIPAGTVIGTMSMPNNMRGFALRNNNVLFAIVSSYDGSARYTIHSDRDTFNINPRSF